MQPAGALAFRTREQLVYDHLRQAIVRGQWGPDDPIVGSRVAGQLGVSRITLANALKRLSGEGFVRLTPHKEAFVSALSTDDVEEIYTMRAALEGEIVAFAARRVTAADLAALRTANYDLARLATGHDVAAVRALDHAFHARLRTIANAPRLETAIGNLVDQCEYYRVRLLDLRRLSMPSAEAHDRLLQALEARDADHLRTLAREHVLAGMRSVLEVLAQSSRTPKEEA
jgi:DNA-binding GntR family transcriptional regulator